MNTYKVIRKTFLPAGLVLAVILSFLIPAQGILLKNTLDQNILIIAIFLVCGIQTSVSDLQITRRSIFFLAAGAVLTLLICPLFAWVTTLALGLAALPAIGLIVVAAAPPTLSSGIVMTETAGGNHVTAIAVTMIYNLAAVVTIPLVLAFSLPSGTEVNTDPVNMLKKLFLLVVVPFAAGFFLKKLLKFKAPSWLSFVSSFAVILLIFYFFSASNERIREISAMMLFKGALATVIIHFGSMAAFWFGGKALHLPENDCKAYLFTAASKTLTMALTTLAIIGADGGDAVAPCIIFYFIQMVFDSSLAAKMGLSDKSRQSAGA